jgi:hypothetical protein
MIPPSNFKTYQRFSAPLKTSNHITGISHYGNGAFSESLMPRSSSISFPSLDTRGSARKISYYI